MLKTITFHKDIMEQSAKHGFTNATDAADYLVNHGVLTTRELIGCALMFIAIVLAQLPDIRRKV